MQPQNPYPGPPPAPQPNYDFILSPQTPAKTQGKNPLHSTSLPIRLLICLVGLFILVIVVVVIKGILSGKGTTWADWTSVAQQQQELIHLTSDVNQNTQQQSNLSTTDQNFTQTSQLVLASEQQQLLAYMNSTSQKIDSKELSLRVSSAVDTELNTALGAGTFAQSFQQVMQQQLTQYEQDLNTANKATVGQKGQQLLKSDYNGAQLLTQQLSSPAS